MNPIDRAMAGAASAPLSAVQKARVAMAASRAWQLEARPHYDGDAYERRDPLALSPGEALELWRHEEQAKACGKKHLTACTQADYPALMAHFLRLGGDLVDAGTFEERAALDPRRQAMAKLRDTWGEVRDVIPNAAAYAGAIARRQFKAGLDDLTAKQLWSLVYTLRNRASARRGTRRTRG